VLTKTEVCNLRDNLDNLLGQLKLDGWKLTLGRCTYGETAIFKLECSPVRADGTVTDKSAEDFKRYALLMYGLEPSDLGREFSFQGRRFKITGAKPRATKMPILAKDVGSGKVFKFAPATVKTFLQLTAPK
jgi:hypothetical protein